MDRFFKNCTNFYFWSRPRRLFIPKIVFWKFLNFFVILLLYLWRRWGKNSIRMSQWQIIISWIFFAPRVRHLVCVVSRKRKYFFFEFKNDNNSKFSMPRFFLKDIKICLMRIFDRNFCQLTNGIWLKKVNCFGIIQFPKFPKSTKLMGILDSNWNKNCHILMMKWWKKV